MYIAVYTHIDINIQLSQHIHIRVYIHTQLHTIVYIQERLMYCYINTIALRIQNYKPCICTVKNTAKNTNNSICTTVYTGTYKMATGRVPQFLCKTM